MEPGDEIEVASAPKDPAPKYEFSSINYYAKDIEGRLENFQSQTNREDLGSKNMRGSIYSHIETREKTSPAASIPTKIKDIPLTVRWIYTS